MLGIGARVSATPRQTSSAAPSTVTGAPKQTPPAVPSFKASVDLVRISAVVRDRKGRFVKNLSVRDFEIFDGGEKQRITDFQLDRPGLSVALLVDISGSMEARMDHAREAATFVLSGLDPVQDEAAVFTFDTQLDEVAPFAVGRQTLPERMSAVRPFGATSLHDAIAGTARRLTSREGLRRAVIVFTDGSDNWSQLSPAEAAEAASAIDVPVYIVGIVPLIDNPSSDISAAASVRSLAATLSNLATLTGGRSFSATTSMDRSATAQQILEELRHQYLIAFEAGSKPGWHSLVVRTRDKDLVVRARSGYNAGQSRPIS
jgi:VWFA-related protein